MGNVRDTNLMNQDLSNSVSNVNKVLVYQSWLKAQHSENEDHDIWSHHFMGNRWETVETVSDFIFLGSKITAYGNCHEIKRCLLLGRKVMTSLESILKRRDIAD